jgi:hypothetical protein
LGNTPLDIEKVACLDPYSVVVKIEFRLKDVHRPTAVPLGMQPLDYAEVGIKSFHDVKIN